MNDQRSPATEAEVDRFVRELARLVAAASERRAKMAPVGGGKGKAA